MDAVTLLDRAHEAGLTVVADGDHLQVTGPRSAAAIVAELGQHKPAVLAVLTGTACARCGTAAERLVVAYWGSAYCSPCCRLVAAEHDRDGTWPVPPWPTTTPDDPTTVIDYTAEWAAAGEATKHEWMTCDRCGETQLIATKDAGRACHLTFGCKGRVHRTGTSGQ